MATTKWNIANRAGSLVKDLDSNLGSPILAQFVEDIAISTENYTGQGIDLTDIGSKYWPALTAGAAAYCLGYMNGVGVSYTAGRMNIDKTTELEGQQKALEFFVSQFNANIKSIGRRIEHTKTEPSG
jgi:hypothetical protein